MNRPVKATTSERVNAEQRALENLDAWARRGDAWVRQTAAALTRKLLDQRAR